MTMRAAFNLLTIGFIAGAAWLPYTPALAAGEAVGQRIPLLAEHRWGESITEARRVPQAVDYLDQDNVRRFGYGLTSLCGVDFQVSILFDEPPRPYDFDRTDNFPRLNRVIYRSHVCNTKGFFQIKGCLIAKGAADCKYNEDKLSTLQYPRHSWLTFLTNSFISIDSHCQAGGADWQWLEVEITPFKTAPTR